MAKNLTQLHKQVDRIMEKLSALDQIRNEQREMRLQTRYLAQMVTISQQMLEAQRVALEQQRQTTEDIAIMTREAMTAARESAERTAAILGEIRKH